MKKLVLVLLLVLGFGTWSWGQERTQDPEFLYDSDRASNPIFDKLNEPHEQYHQLLFMHDPILYLGILPSFSPSKTRLAPLDDGEGNKGYLLEGNLDHRFTLYKGAYYSPKFLQKLRWTFDAGFTLRMTNDTSSPLLPSNNKFGLGVDYLISALEKSPAYYLWMTVQLHHYSNGQAKNDFLHESKLRNNYKGGDFSTNYIRGLFYGAKPFAQHSVGSIGLGYQYDTQLFGPLRVTDEMKAGDYGMNRLLLNIQYLNKNSFKVKEDNGMRTLIKNCNFMFRSEMSFILDDNLKALAPTDKKYRFGVHNYAAFYPFAKSSVGFMIKHYYGRDYLNMRYDDVVNSFMAGITVDVNRINR